MAELTWTLEDGQEQSLTFDATVRDSHEATATITEHPIEEGANISDHVRKDLDRVTLSIVVSNTPIVSPADHNDGVAGTVQSVQLTGPDGQELARAQVLVFDGGVTRVRSVYEELLDLLETGTRVNLLTSLRDYEGMAVKRVSPIREAQSGDALVATVELQELQVVSSEIVAAPEPREPRGNTGQERGRENTEDEDEAGQSLLAAGLDGLTNFFGGGS
jgi:hypothetical protein